MGTALVTGFSGFLGRHTVTALELDGWHVIRAGRQRPTGNDRASYVYLDLESPSSIANLELSQRPDVIIHLGAKVDFHPRSIGELYAANVLATGLLAHLATQCGGRIVFASTALIHGIRQERISIDEKVVPDTFYACSKHLAEKLIEASGVNSCVLRFGGLFGREGPDHLGINRAIDGALNGAAPTRVGEGSAKRNYLYVKDAARAVARAAAGLVGTHLVAGSEILSIAEMLEEVCHGLAPDILPLFKAGSEAPDQIIVPSPDFGPSLSFRQAIADIRSDEVRCG